MDDEILPFGTLLLYVSSTLLNGFLNYLGQPVGAYVISHYRKWDEVLESGLTKDETYRRALESPTFHTDLSQFSDDVLLLFCVGDRGWPATWRDYWFLWFNCDVSDCCIGRFQTYKPQNEVVESFDSYVAGLRMDDLARPIPPKCFAGWMKF